MGDGLSGRLRGCTLDQESIEHSHHAREETVCMVLESQTQPHHELPFTQGEEFLEVMPLDQGAGVWPVFEGGSSSSSGPLVPEDAEGSTPVKKLATPTAPTAEDREEHTASGHALFRTWC